MLVLLYHKVIKNPGFDLWWRTFDLQIKILKSTYKIVSLDEVLDCVINGKCQKNAVAITFDDGYADNYIYAYPILKKHKVKATLFLATSRVLLEEKKRPTLLDYWEGKVSWEELYRPKSMKDANAEFVRQGKSTDFLTLEEIKSMRDVFSFGWHSHWHLKAFERDEVIDFYDGDGHWSLLHAYKGDLRKGYPIFPMKGSLAIRAGSLKPEVKEFIRSLGDNFFEKRSWKKELKELLKRNFDSLLTFETEEEMKSRIEEDFKTSMGLLKNFLGGSVEHGAYPFGDYSDELKKKCREYLRACFTTEKMTVKPYSDPYAIPRITVPKDIWSFFAILTRSKLGFW
jgi:hypothetical protein